MNNVEELFKNLEGSEYLAYLEYVEETSRQVTSQTYGEIVGVIKEIEGGSPLSLYLLKGRILEEEPDQYVTAEIGSYETDKILYVYFNRIDDEKNFSILAKITATELDRYDQIFTQRNCDSMESSSLKSNEIIVNGIFCVSEYLAICDKGDWYTYLDREKGKSLVVPSVQNGSDFVLLSNRLKTE